MRYGLLLSLVAAGCGHYEYTRTTRNAAAPRDAACAFDLLTVRPSRPFVELGVLEGATPPAGTAAQFKNAIRSTVCRVGGDAVLGELNDAGAYARGTVIKYQ